MGICGLTEEEKCSEVILPDNEKPETAFASGFSMFCAEDIIYSEARNGIILPALPEIML